MLTVKLFVIVVVALSVSGVEVGDNCACNSSPDAQGECLYLRDSVLCGTYFAEGCGCGEVGDTGPDVVKFSD